MLLIADNLQATDLSLSAAIDNYNPGPITELICKCEKAGAQAIDVNTGPLKKDAVKKMEFIVNTIQNTTPLPLSIDTANPEAMAAGIAACKNKCMINGFSLEPEKLKFMLPIAKRFRTDIIGYLLFPDSQVPTNAQDRLSIAIEIYQAAMDAGIHSSQLIIDPILVPIMWQNGSSQAKDILDVIRQLPEVLGFPVRTVIGLSNLAAGKGHLEQKRLMEKTYASMLSAAGLSMILLNMFHTQTVKSIQAARLIMDQTLFTWESLS